MPDPLTDAASTVSIDLPAAAPDALPPELWHSLFAHAPDAMLLLGPDGVIVDANRAAETIYGYGRDELRRLRIHDLRDPATLPTLAGQLERAASDPAGVTFVSRHRHRAGATFPVEVSSRGLPVEGARLLLSVIRDIGEREAVEGRLRRSEERFRSLVEATSVATWVATADGRLVDPLARWSTLTGLPPAALADDPLGAVHPDDIRRGTESWWAAVRAGLPIEFEQRVRQPNGSWRHLLVRAAPVREADGTVREWIGVDLDVTARARAEAAVREAEARFRATFEQAALGVALCDPDGYWIEFNRAFCAIVGYEPAELRALTWRDVTHPEDAAAEAPMVARMLAGEIPGYTLEKRYRRKDGSTVWVEVAVTLKRAADGSPEYIIGVIADVSERRAALASLAAANERFRIAERASDGFVYDLDLGSGRSERTAGLERVTGYRPEETSGDGEWWRRLIHPDDAARARAEGRAAIEEGRANWSLEYRVRHRDGHDVHVWDRATIVRDAAGHAVRVVGSTVDVTERTRREAALRGSEARFRSLTENMAFLVWQMDPAGNPEYLNPYGLAYLGVDLDRYRRMGHAPFLHPDDHARFLEQWEQIRQCGESLDSTFRMRGADGRYRWFDGHGEAVRDGQGRIVSWVGAAIDIHDRTEAEALARRHAALLDQASDAIFAWDWGGAITYWNRGASRLYGYTAEEAIGRVSHDLLQTVHPLPLSSLLAALEGEGVWEGEVVHTTRDGREIPVETRQQVVREDDRVMVLEANRDVSERKNVEAAQQAFHAAVAHDLKNPLAASKAQVQLLRRRIRAGRADLAMVDEALAGLDRNDTRLNRRIDELADAMRLRSGFALELERRPTDLVAMLEANVESYRRATERHEIRLAAAVPSLTIAVDPDRIDRVIDNLLGNAVKYSPRGGPIVVRVWREETASGGMAIFSVEDAGVGIPAADLPQIFDQYHRGSNVEGRIVGSGIGLAGARQIVAQHGGTVEVASEEGRGSTFTVRLPLRPSLDVDDS